nr:MAG TPA: hypothetical protein [Caudoviricetes sp.]
MLRGLISLFRNSIVVPKGMDNSVSVTEILVLIVLFIFFY